MMKKKERLLFYSLPYLMAFNYEVIVVLVGKTGKQNARLSK